MDNQDLDNRIKEFLKNKHFENPFIQECITEFIKGHTQLYGDVISADELFERLETNLDRITFAGHEKAQIGDLGAYKVRDADNTDLNEIIIYSNESDLELSEFDKKYWNIFIEKDKQKLLQELAKRRAEIKSTLIHELTHSAYTIKNANGMGEKHIFSEISKLNGEYRLTGGNNDYIEAIVNFIASRIEGKSPYELETYKAETQAIYMLAEKVDEKSIIQASWNSDEQQFKQSYINAIAQEQDAGEKSYNSFHEGMKKLVIIRERNTSNLDKNIYETVIKEIYRDNKETLSEIQQILDGKTLELKSNKFKELKRVKGFETIQESNIPELGETLSFTQKIAKFLSRSNSLMRNPFVKNFVDKKLNVLPPARSKSSSNSQRIDFIKKLSNNDELRNLPQIQPNQRIQNLDKTNKQINEGKVK